MKTLETPQPTSRSDVIPLRICSSWLSFLVSSGLHLFFLVVLTLIFVGVPAIEPLQLEFSIASASSDESFESFEMEMPVSEAPDVPSDASNLLASSNQVGVEQVEVSLVDVGQLIGSPQQGDGDGLTDAISASAADKSNRRGSFFGAQAYGDEFVFVVDNSRSMLSPCGFRYGHTRFQVAVQELLRSIKSLDEDQKFCVIFFGLRTRVMFDRRPKLIKASESNREKLVKWIGTLSPGEGTDPRLGVLQAMKLKPSAVFLLSDGEFNGQNYNIHNLPGNPTVERIIQRQLHSAIPIHTIAFEDVYNRRRLRNIATLTAGTHKFIGSESEQQLLIRDLTSGDGVDCQYALQTIIDDASVLGNDRFIKPATLQLTKFLSVRNRELRETSHQALLALADSLEVEARELTEIDSLADARTSKFTKDAWIAVWRDYFRSRDAETRLTRVVSP